MRCDCPRKARVVFRSDAALRLTKLETIMATPVTTGKSYTKSTVIQRPVRGGGTVSLVTEYDVVSGQRQAAPIDRVLPYQRTRGTVTKWVGHSYSEDGANYVPAWPATRTAYLSRAYENMRGQAFDSIELGANLAEYREAHDLVLGTYRTLIGVARAFKAGDIAKALRLLGLSSKTRPRKVKPKRLEGYEGASRQLASNWLAYVFGIEPLFQDLYNGLDILQQPIKSLKVKGRGNSGLYRSLWTETVTGPLPWSTWKYYGKFRLEEYRCEVGAEVRIDNPALHFLEQLGLLNPASVAWEVVPFSFVADWVSNAGDCLRRLTDFAGCSLTMTYHSERVKWQAWSYDRQTSQLESWSVSTNANGSNFRRLVGLPSNSFALKPIALPPVRRLFTASALLVSLLPKRS